MRVLFGARHAFYLRNFESLLRELGARGHEVHMAFEIPPRHSFWEGLVEVLNEEVPGFSSGLAPKRASRRWRRTSRELRRALDYLPYLDRRYDRAPSLRERARERAPRLVRRVAESPAARRSPAVRRVLGGVLRAMEEAVPVSLTLEQFVREHRPDVVVVSPLLQVGSRQPDLLRAARAVGVPSVFSAYSWDNLTTKGRVRGDPDLVTVWNEVQGREAVELHGVVPERVTATGATAYDHWFGWEPRTSREQFCATVGLDPGRPYVLYVGSALLSGEEAGFVREWVTALRAGGHPVLREAGLLVRPHPQRPPAAGALDFAEEADVAVWPPPDARALGLEARETLFDSIFHAAAVVGLNTSAFIDAGIIGRPSYAVRPSRFRDSQEGTLHFRYLREAGGGLLTVADSLGEHAGQLAAVLADPGGRPVPRERFVEAFVRPAGIDVPATGALADAIERQAAAGPRAVRRRRVERLGGLVLALALSEALRWRDEGVPRRVVRRGRRLGRDYGKRLRSARKRFRRRATTALGRPSRGPP